MPRTSRKPEILQALAHMLEDNPGGKITTAKLAKEVGLSEAALYRHFPSKAKMIEGLIEFIEETLFSRMAAIAKDEHPLAGEVGGIHRARIPGHAALATALAFGLEPQQLLQFPAEHLSGADANRHGAHRGHAELPLQPAAAAIGNFGVEADVGLGLGDAA